MSRLENLPGAEINEAKKILADAVTTLAHGAEAAATARRTAEETFEQGGSGGDLPTLDFPIDQQQSGLSVIDALVKLEFAASKGKARDLIKGGGVRLNDEKVDDANRLITVVDLRNGQAKLSAGRKRHAIIQAV